MRFVSQRLFGLLVVVALAGTIGCEADEAEETEEVQQAAGVDEEDEGEESDEEATESEEDAESDESDDEEESDDEDDASEEDEESDDEEEGEDGESEDEEEAEEGDEDREAAVEELSDELDMADFEDAEDIEDLGTPSVEDFEHLPIRAEGPVAEINGEEVTALEFNVVAQQQLAGMPPENVQTQGQQMKNMLLEGVVADRLIQQEIDNRDIEVSDAEIDEAIEEFEELMEMQAGDQLGEMRALMEQQGIDDAALREQAEQQLAAEKLLGDSGELTVTEEEVRQHYQQSQAQFQHGEPETRARHVLLNVDDHEEGESNEDEMRARAEELLDEVGETSEQFAEVAREHSDCPSAGEGGDLGYFTREQLMPEFTEAAFELDEGEVSSQPVRSNLGWHIIRVEDQRDEGGPEFEEVRDELEMSLEAQKLQQAAAQLVQQLRADADVETHEDNVIIDG